MFHKATVGAHGAPRYFSKGPRDVGNQAHGRTTEPDHSNTHPRPRPPPRSTVDLRKTVEEHVLLENDLQENLGQEDVVLAELPPRKCALINPNNLSMSTMLKPLVIKSDGFTLPSTFLSMTFFSRTACWSHRTSLGRDRFSLSPFGLRSPYPPWNPSKGVPPTTILSPRPMLAGRAPRPLPPA